MGSGLSLRQLNAEHQKLGLAGKQRLWQICGPIGKLHYIVVYVLRTPQRRRAFKAGGEDWTHGVRSEA